MFDGVAFVAFVVADGDSVGVSIMRYCDDSNKITEIFNFKLFYSLIPVKDMAVKKQKPESIRCY